MSATFFYIGTIPKTVLASNLPDELPNKIWEQQSQFAPTLTVSNIKILEHAYVDAEPNCWMVYAKWKQV